MDPSTEAVCADSEKVSGILQSLQERVGPQKYRAWFRNGTTLRLNRGHLEVAVANPFVANWIESHYIAELTEAVEAHTDDEARVVVTVDPDLGGKARKRQLDDQADIVRRTGAGRTRPRHNELRPAPLRYRLESFVVGGSNRLAYSAALAVSRGAEPPFNPLFIHGPCGVGKTHLLQGICNTAAGVRRSGSPLRYRYVTAEQFTNEFIASLRQRKLEAFRARYRALDLLAIDDVHFLAAKKATQDEFLHTYNAIESAGRQVVLASDAHPRLVGELNEQLTSRFLSGMVVRVDPPDQATRQQILQRRADEMKLQVDETVLEYVASHVRGSVRELEGTLIKLAALSALDNGKLTLPLVMDALSEHLARSDSAVTLGDIEAAVAAFFGITTADIHSSRRTRTISAARMVAVYLARRHTQMSFPEIGRSIGKNHSSVVLSVKRMERLLENDQSVRWNTPAGARSMKADKLVELLTEQFTR